MKIETFNNNLGTIEVSREVLEVIANIAVTETEGVHQLQNNFKSGNIEKLGKKFRGRGIKVEDSDGIRISVYVSLFGNKNIHKTAENIQKNIAQTIHTMTGHEITEINVYVVNIK